MMSMCRVFSCVVGRGCLLWTVLSLGKTLLAIALLHSVFQGQICLLLQVFLDFLLSALPRMKRLRRQWHPTPLLLPGKSHDGGAWKAAVHGVAEGQTRLSNFIFMFHFHALEKEMATHSSVLAWRIPGMGSLLGCRLWGHAELDTTKATEQQQGPY